jgi:hypothetical protein
VAAGADIRLLSQHGWHLCWASCLSLWKCLLSLCQQMLVHHTGWLLIAFCAACAGAGEPGRQHADCYLDV